MRKRFFLHPLSIMNKTQISMTEEQWRTVIDAVNDKYPDSDCMDILINSVTHFPTFIITNHVPISTQKTQQTVKSV